MDKFTILLSPDRTPLSGQCYTVRTIKLTNLFVAYLVENHA